MNLYQPVSPYEDKPGFFARHYYVQEPRTPIALKDLTIRRYGAMLETLVDALHLVVVAEKQEEPLAMRDPAFVLPDTLPPSYVMETLGDYRSAPSFFRRDRARLPASPARPVKSVALPEGLLTAEALHRQSRNLGSHFGALFNHISWEGDDRTRRLVERYDAKVDEYKEHIKRYGNADLFSHNKDVFDTFNREFSEIVTALKEQLGQVTKFTLTVNDKPYCVSNEPLMNGNFAASHPLQVMFAFRLAGKEGIDTDVHPKIGFYLLTDMLGVESDLLLVMHNLERHLRDQTQEPLEFFGGHQKQQVKKAIEKGAHGLQLLHDFHGALGRLSDAYHPPYQRIAYDDLVQMLAFAGREPRLSALDSPKEMALMLYALAKRFSRSAAAIQQQVDGLSYHMNDMQNGGMPPVADVAFRLQLAAATIADAPDKQQAVQRLQAGYEQPLAMARLYASILRDEAVQHVQDLIDGELGRVTLKGQIFKGLGAARQ